MYKVYPGRHNPKANLRKRRLEKAHPLSTIREGTSKTVIWNILNGMVHERRENNAAIKLHLHFLVQVI